MKRGSALPKLMYGALPQSISADSTSVVDRPKSVSLTTTLRSDRPSGSVVHPSVTMKFSGLMSRWKTELSWQVATASHICENIDAIRRRRVRESSCAGLREERRLGVGGVREAQLESETGGEVDKSIEGSVS